MAEVRRAHPELRRPATWATARRAIARMGIPVHLSRETGRSGALARLGVAVIVLSTSLPDRERLPALLHELGHVVLHADRDGGAVRDLMPCGPDDPREHEADYFAAELLAGPRREVYAQAIVCPPSGPAGASWPYGPHPDRLRFELSRLLRGAMSHR